MDTVGADDLYRVPATGQGDQGVDRYHQDIADTRR
jgi:hypothetical protein